MLIRVTGSQLDRVARCPASAALPQIIDANDEDNKARERGTVMHRFLERVAAVGRMAALIEVDNEHRDFCSDIEIVKLTEQLKLSTEVAVAYNWQSDTARLLTPIAPRAYEIDPECEVALTLDLVGVGKGVVYVGDYKSGHGWLPEPESSYQLGVGALAIARVFGAKRAHIEYIRVRDDGTVRKFGAHLDVLALDAASDRVRELMSGIPALRATIEAGVVPSVVEGRWCRYCSARQHCPAKTALIRHVLTDAQPVPYLLPLTPESAQRAYAMLAPARAAIAQIEAAIYGYAKTTPIPVCIEEDGSERWFGELERPGNDQLDGAITHQVLTELYGGEAANTAVTMEVTKAAVTNVVRSKLLPTEKITIVTKEVLEAIGARGGISNPTTRSTTEYTIAPDGEIKARKRKAS